LFQSKATAQKNLLQQ